MRVLVTGASGFIGRAVLTCLASKEDFQMRGSIRREGEELGLGVEPFLVESLGPSTNWQEALAGVEVVIHTAARVHVMRDMEADPLAAYRHVNVHGTLNLARQAVGAGVRRFIFLSSIKVNGEETHFGKSCDADDMPAPLAPYGISKYEAEVDLLQLSCESEMEVVIIRSPLVYGPGVKANFYKMMCWLYKGVPLPLGGICNKRSLVALDNLVDLIVTCIVHPMAANQVFLAADGENVSTSELLQRLGKALGKTPRLISVPSWMVKFVAALCGKKMEVQRLYSSLQVDITKTRNRLNWSPPVSVDEALQKAAQYFLESQSR